MRLVRQHIIDYLSKHTLMMVATNGEHPWIATVYYAFDKDMTLFFVSSPNTLHIRHILENPMVAVAIADTRQDIQKPKKGMQLWGYAKEITDYAEMRKALKMWKVRLGVKNPKLTVENIQKNAVATRIFEIRPKKIKYFNQELFPVADGEEPVFEVL